MPCLVTVRNLVSACFHGSLLCKERLCFLFCASQLGLIKMSYLHLNFVSKVTDLTCHSDQD